MSSDKLSGIGVRPRLASSASGPKVVTSASAHSANWKKVLGLWCELVSRHATCSPHFAGALDSEHKEVLLSQMLSRMADTTLLRYLRSVMLFFDMMDTMRLHLSDLHQANVMDVLLCLQEASGGPLVAQINQVKALRWYVRASGIPFPDLYGGLFLSVMQPPDGERREAVPLPLAVVVALERLVLDPAQPSKDRLIAAAFLTCVWASLRFSDSQRVLWSSLLLDFSSLRGVSHRTKTTRRGVPFICVGSGLLGQHDSRDTWWTTAFLNLLEERRQALCAHLQTEAFAPDALFFWDELQTGDGEVDACFAPLQYGVALNWLRKFFVSIGFGSDTASVYTLHSAKATVLSWMNQLLLSPSLRAMQGHHKVDSVTLYGRDDVWLPLSGQRALRRALLLGWRPTTPQHRGGQQPLQEPPVLLPALEAVGDFPPEGVALPVLSEEAVSESTAFEEAVPLPPAEVPADDAFTPEPSSTRQQPLGDMLGRSDTESLGPAEEFAFLSSSTGVIHVCSSAFRSACGLWSDKFSVLHELPAGARLCKHRACHLALLSA